MCFSHWNPCWVGFPASMMHIRTAFQIFKKLINHSETTKIEGTKGNCVSKSNCLEVSMDPTTHTGLQAQINELQHQVLFHVFSNRWLLNTYKVDECIRIKAMCISVHNFCSKDQWMNSYNKKNFNVIMKQRMGTILLYLLRLSIRIEWIVWNQFQLKLAIY